ncbi:cupin domain-containing protein [Siculibacillus lacustris]|uniref:Cupin domain-containing protein n=1 Tax=Siculibacillus lacustris TaxID=1549641 RepID=A0A4Q9VXL5_9HYPH|nr:cupin domain-containing protein [Siculibacillus lacustris]TBW41227.1 cupin domain-containing protein [Siculibacillus lacustris]
MNSPRDIDVGRRLKDLRLAHGLSQRALAKRAGVSNATISMIEADRVSPSVSALKQILAGFPIGLSAFFAAEETEAEKVVWRADEFTEIAGGAISYRQVGGDLTGRSLQMMHERYRPGTDSGRPTISHQGEEAGLVIRGLLELEVDGARYELKAGDAYFFDSRKPHAFRNIGDTDLVIVSACTPPSF